MRLLLVAVVAALLAAGSAMPCSAAEKPADKSAPAKKDARAKTKPFNGKIKSIDVTGKTVTLEGEKAQTYQIISETRITKDGKPATFDDLKEGDAVGGRARETADGKWDAQTVNAGKKPVRSDKAKPAEKPAKQP